MSFTRITTLMTTNQILGEINSSQTALAQTEQELSTGKTINAPSDNPYGAALAVQLNGQLSQLSDYNNNITDGQAWTQSATSALGSIQQQVQRAQELVTEAGNGTMSPRARPTPTRSTTASTSSAARRPRPRPTTRAATTPGPPRW
jgi:flagellar hook-associated protein 3 FlgL